MTASVKVLTTSTIDSSPSILIVSPNGHKTLVNCGEGCQRSFLESTDRVRSVNQICLTHIGYTATGGLPGMILTSADAAQASANSLKDAENKNSDHENSCNKDIVGTLRLIGPHGLKDFAHSLRHFMRRDRFPLIVHEGVYHSVPRPGDGLNSRHGKGKGKKRKKAGEDVDEEETASSNDLGLFGITSIPMKKNVQTFYGNETVSICSYLFTTTPIAGKFQIQKARDLGIPPGPLYSQLKSGKSVTFCHPDHGRDVTIAPDEVLEGGSDGVAVAVIYCPDEEVLDQFCDDNNNCSETMSSLNQYKEWNRKEQMQPSNEKGKLVTLELMVHITPKDIFESSSYQNWITEFGKSVKHMTIHPLQDHKFSGGNEESDGSPFRSAIHGAMQRSLIDKDIFPSPIPFENDWGIVSEKRAAPLSEVTVYNSYPGLEYTIMPLSKQGIDPATTKTDERVHGLTKGDFESIIEETKASGSIEEVKRIKDKKNDEDSINGHEEASALVNKECSKGCFIFTGTGSAIPCKYRNVTGMYLEMKNGNSILLDVGEGTLGQLIRSWKSCYVGDNYCDYVRQCILNIKAVWISHPHADHHLGIIRFLTQRNSILRQNGVKSSNNDPVVLMTSQNVLRFLDEYSKVDPSIYDGYVPVDNRETLPELPKNPELLSMLEKRLGVTGCVSVPVSHCYQSYAVVLDNTSFGRLVYSGDCRPSDHLVQVGQGADLLVHEATFENGMEQEAVLKMHSTVSEALSVAKRMGVKACILTHFSQRYPRIAPLLEEDSCLPFPVAFAFDFMKIRPHNIGLSSILTPALRLLYPEDKDVEGSKDELCEASEAKKRAQELLSTPGYFANMKCS
jgi:Metal-dependent hydrolases of the beta-lactamase superfamily III